MEHKLDTGEQIVIEALYEKITSLQKRVGEVNDTMRKQLAAACEKRDLDPEAWVVAPQEDGTLALIPRPEEDTKKDAGEA